MRPERGLWLAPRALHEKQPRELAPQAWPQEQPEPKAILLAQAELLVLPAQVSKAKRRALLREPRERPKLVPQVPLELRPELEFPVQAPAFRA